MNLFINTSDNKRYHTLNYHYKKVFNTRVSKISLDAHFTCPNIDGKTGFGGCIYCKQAPNNDDLLKQFEMQKKIIDHKWPNSKYIGFFQANTNTYAPLSILKEKYELILNLPNVIGLSISTRPDAISNDVLDYLEQLNKNTYLTIELGLQTIHEKTSKLINRCHTLECFTNMVKELRKRNINVVVHIINGLPYETKEMMIETVKLISTLDIQGLKIHMMHIVKDTPLENLYNKKPFHLLTKNEYVDIVCDQLELLPSNIVIHRLTGDPVKEQLVEPTWVLKKVSVLDDIDKELAKRNTFQGFNLSINNRIHQILDNCLSRNDIVIDTKINSNITLFLSKIITTGHIYRLDANSNNLTNIKNLLDGNEITNYTLLNGESDQILNLLPQLKQKVSAIIFDFSNSIGNPKLIDTALKMLNNKGIILITINHETKEKIFDYLKTIDSSLHIKDYRSTNDDDPFLIVIDKQGEK